MPLKITDIAKEFWWKKLIIQSFWDKNAPFREGKYFPLECFYGESSEVEEYDGIFKISFKQTTNLKRFVDEWVAPFLLWSNKPKLRQENRFKT